MTTQTIHPVDRAQAAARSGMRREPTARLSDAALDAWRASFLGTTIPAVGELLLEDAHEQHLAADETLSGDGSILAVIVGGLTFFPALALGPIAEQLAVQAGPVP